MAGGFRATLKNGVAILDWRAESSRINLLNTAEIDSLEAAIEKHVADPDVRAIVIGSSRADLGGGVDLETLCAESGGSAPARAEFALSKRLHGIFRRIETCGKPVAAATPGSAVGGVLELMLACHRRFAAPNPKARIGLPEIRVGLFPAAGGTTRLVRMFGLQAGGQLLLEGTLLPPRKAAEAGLIDEIASDPVASAVAWAESACPSDAVKPWDRPGYRMPGGGPYTREGFDTFCGAAVLVQTRSRGNYPAAEALLQALYEGSLVSFDEALEIEARLAARVAALPQTRATIRTNFLSRRQLRSGARRPACSAPEPVARIGVVGAGMMGAGIAYVAARAGIRATLLDRTPKLAEAGLASVRSRAERSARRGRSEPGAVDELLANVRASDDYDSLRDCDLVIEAVFEDPGIKAEVLRKASGALGEGAILASNTSTLPISGLAQSVDRASRFVGIHFFSPVERMDLVEVIRGDETEDAAVSRALDLVQAIGKTPIVVRDARFFYANRCIIPYTVETAGLLPEGVHPARIEQACLRAGMPLGCLQLIDETSLDLGAQILLASRKAQGASHRPHPGEDVFLRMALEEKRLGRKADAGFYDYEEGKRTRLWPGLAELWPVSETQPEVESLAERLLAVQAVEAVRTLEEGVLQDVREGDVGAVLGWGFAPWSGGPFAWLDAMGTARACGMLEALAERHGARFRPPDLLRDLARADTGFYRRFGSAVR